MSQVDILWAVGGIHNDSSGWMTEVEKDVHSFKCENCCSRLHMAHLRAPQILLDSHFQLSSLCLPSRSQSGFPGAYI